MNPATRKFNFLFYVSKINFAVSKTAPCSTCIVCFNDRLVLNKAGYSSDPFRSRNPKNKLFSTPQKTQYQPLVYLEATQSALTAISSFCVIFGCLPFKSENQRNSDVSKEQFPAAYHPAERLVFREQGDG
ncbi:MAG: hypothetical protein ABFS03_11385 [Chloroflexota bacterium]